MSEVGPEGRRVRVAGAANTWLVFEAKIWAQTRNEGQESIGVNLTRVPMASVLRIETADRPTRFAYRRSRDRFEIDNGYKKASTSISKLAM
ncbi:hypothetical protein MesoLj113a_74190 [Mesorhizobium sp. 113-1-2]|nr:hypothetical protein MesoLj113a_74190 [Mesorhizobium sp. 113-1-2]